MRAPAPMGAVEETLRHRYSANHMQHTTTLTHSLPPPPHPPHSLELLQLALSAHFAMGQHSVTTVVPEVVPALQHAAYHLVPVAAVATEVAPKPAAAAAAVVHDHHEVQVAEKLRQVVAALRRHHHQHSQRCQAATMASPQQRQLVLHHAVPLMTTCLHSMQPHAPVPRYRHSSALTPTASTPTTMAVP